MVEISKLIESKLIDRLYGNLPDKPIRLALPVWALKGPKPVFRAFIRLAQAISEIPLTILVDDVCAQCMIANRTSGEQGEINSRYVEFFASAGCQVEFSSAFFQRMYPRGVIGMFLDVGSRVSLSRFTQLLPAEKRLAFSDLGMEEVVHAICELAVLDYASWNCNTLIVGRFSQAMVVLHRDIAPKPLPAIITPKFQGVEHSEMYISQIDDLEVK